MMDFLQYELNISYDKIHSLLYYATMYIGDSQTMTSEAAILGTPAIKCNTFAGKLSIPNELEYKYKLCYSFKPEEESFMFNKINELLKIKNIKNQWKKRREKMLNDKIDVTAFFVWLIDHFPESIKLLRKYPGYQYRFK